MNNIKKLIFKTETGLSIPPEDLFEIFASERDPELGTGSFDIRNGEPNEVIGISFEQVAGTGAYSNANLHISDVEGVFSIATLTPGLTYTEGTVTLSVTGNAESLFGIAPVEALTEFRVTILTRSSGLPYGIGFMTEIKLP